MMFLEAVTKYQDRDTAVSRTYARVSCIRTKLGDLFPTWVPVAQWVRASDR